MPTELLPLHVFEPRYRSLMEHLTAPGAVPELGVVLIERGSEVGGGDQRVAVGTVARLVTAEQLADGRWVALLAGAERFRVVEWLPDDPYPQAVVERMPEPAWDSADDANLAAAEHVVRRALALAAELGEPSFPAGQELSPAPARRAWELCALAPLGPLDRQRLLEAPRAVRLVTLIQQADDAGRMLAFRLRGGQ
jgi:Lon protease-like protein